MQATRDYFTFDLSGVEPNIAAAALRIFHPINSYDSPDASEAITFFDVSTLSATLEAPDETQGLALLMSIFGDLGSGTIFGGFVSNLSDDDTTELVTLNEDAIASLNAAATTGSLWSIGGALTSANVTDFGVFERVFRGSDDTGGNPDPATELVLSLEK